MIEDYDNEDYDYFKEWDIEQYKKEIESLHSIIKEVREYVTKQVHRNQQFYEIDIDNVLEILDKKEVNRL